MILTMECCYSPRSGFLGTGSQDDLDSPTFPNSSLSSDAVGKSKGEGLGVIYDFGKQQVAISLRGVFSFLALLQNLVSFLGLMEPEN
jgi:sorbitol-specific phosphotransferase system component IIBC